MEILIIGDTIGLFGTYVDMSENLDGSCMELVADSCTVDIAKRVLWFSDMMETGSNIRILATPAVCGYYRSVFKCLFDSTKFSKMNILSQNVLYVPDIDITSDDDIANVLDGLTQSYDHIIIGNCDLEKIVPLCEKILADGGTIDVPVHDTVTMVAHETFNPIVSTN